MMEWWESVSCDGNVCYGKESKPRYKDKREGLGNGGLRQWRRRQRSVHCQWRLRDMHDGS